MDKKVAAAFEQFPGKVQQRLKTLRNLILQCAKKTDGVGELTETLKWGEPAYLTEQTKSGSTIRMGWKARDPDHCALYFNCQTTLVDSFRTRFPELHYEGNRALLIPLKGRLPRAELAECITMALTYHKSKRTARIKK